jgi:hypothetical protein
MVPIIGCLLRKNQLARECYANNLEKRYILMEIYAILLIKLLINDLARKRRSPLAIKPWRHVPKPFFDPVAKVVT